jgi:hypothetical protein
VVRDAHRCQAERVVSAVRRPERRGVTVDLLHALQEIQDRALEAQRKLDLGEAVNGRTDLRRIQYEAQDALRRYELERQAA